MTNKQGRPSSWTEEEVKDLIKMRAEDVSIAEIARRLGRSEGAVSGKLWQLREQGRLPSEVDSAGTAENGPSGTPVPTNAAASTEEKGELNPLEQEMAEIIEERSNTIAEMVREIDELKRENERLEKENDGLLNKGIELHNRASDLDRELQDARTALAETERQFDEYRATDANATPIIQKLERDNERLEAEVSRLTRALERANRVALGVVEKFALGEAV